MPYLPPVGGVEIKTIYDTYELSGLTGERQLLFTHMQKLTYTFTGFKTLKVQSETFLNTQCHFEFSMICLFFERKSYAAFVMLTKAAFIYLFIYFI